MCDTCGCSITPANAHLVKAGGTLERTAEGRASVEVLTSLLHENDHQAAHNREHFDRHGVLAINLMSSPGAGKTALLEASIAALRDEFSIAVIEGDLETENDAERIRRHGVTAIQITTGSACHLDAHMVHSALDELDLDGVALPTHAAGRYLGDAQLAPLLEYLDDRSAAVFVHPTSPCCFEAFGLALPAPMIEFPFDTTRAVASLLFSGALARHPGIEFILPHAGGTLPLLAPRIAAIGSTPVLGDRAVPLPDAMQAFARLHYDTALSATPQQIAALRSLAPISQVVYGTDYPFAPEPLVRLADGVIATLFDANEQEQIRCGNAARLFDDLARRAGCANLSTSQPAGSIRST